MIKKRGSWIQAVFFAALIICLTLVPAIPVFATSIDNNSYSLDCPPAVVGSSPYALEVISSSGLGSGLYGDPDAVLGEPATQCKNSWGSDPTFRVKLVEPAYNVDLNDEKVITTINSGGHITVKFDHKVLDDPQNPFGIDLLVFGNAFFVGQGSVSDSVNMNTYLLADPASCFSESVTVSVSQDGTNWYIYDSGPYADSIFPTQAYEWDATGAAWTDNKMDFTKPVNPSLALSDFDGLSAANAIALYDGSGGGTGFDLSESGMSWIQYVKVESSGGEIDAFADVAVPAGTDPAILADIKVTGIAGDIFDVDDYLLPSGTVTEDGFTMDTQTAMGAVVYYCQQNSIDITVQDGDYGLNIYQIGSNVNDENSWMYCVDESSPWVSGDQYALSGGEDVHWYNYMLGLYSLTLSPDVTGIEPGDSVTATVTYTNGEGQAVPADTADVYVSASVDEWGNPVTPGVSVGQTNASGACTFVWNDEGTYYPYAEWNGMDTVYQYPVASFPCSTSTTPAWDVNGDGSINMGDIVAVGLHWGETGTPGWIPEDVNKDGSINMGDIVVIGLHWGE